MKKLFRSWRDPRFVVLALAALVGCAASPTRGDAPPEDDQSVENREVVLEAMQAELRRSMEELDLDDYQPPYFVAYRVSDSEVRSLGGKYGAIVEDTDRRNRHAYVEVRVGDYDFDNYANVSSHTFRFSDFEADSALPLDADRQAIRGTLWLLTDQVYKRALSDYLSKRGGAVFETGEKLSVPSFSSQEPVTHRGEVAPIEFDAARWKSTIRKVTRSVLESEALLDANMSVSARRTLTYFVNSEGTSLLHSNVIYTVQLEGWARAEDGMLLENTRSFYVQKADALPDQEALMAAAGEMVDELEQLRQAEVLDPYTGPAILLPEASGVLFHEAIGHRLEGERQRDDDSGRTFQGRVGESVVPSFLSVYDDPTIPTWDDVELNGAYLFDDEGVPAQRVTLIEDGMLRNYLKSRTPIEDSLESNGHGRAQGAQKPMARMGNLIVEADAKQSYSYDELKQRLIEEVERQGKPFGLIIRDISGGSTNTSGWGYQAFKGVTKMVYKVDPDTGEETLVRGVELVGTPLTAINKIVAASDHTGVFNGYCGAESGYVPVSAIAPSLLTTEVELQRTQQSRERPPLLPAPWRETKDSEEAEEE